MLKVRQNNENRCATFCGKPVESVESVENAHSAKKENFIKPSSAYAPHGRALKRHQNRGAKPNHKKRLQLCYKTAKPLKKLLTSDKIESKKKGWCNTMKGYNDYTGLFKSRYYAKKYAKGDEVIVKVDDGYTIMSADYYYKIWRNQK